MFHKTDPQRSLLESSMLLPEKKLARLKKSIYWVFGTHALPLIDEEPFRAFYCPDNGRPNKSVRTLVGVLILKEMEGLTDEEALRRLDFDLCWHVALGLESEQAQTCQKTLHNFRARLIESDQGQGLFERTCEGVLKTLDLDTGKQRLDSTHVVSNMARLHRLGLFCETIRLFLRALRKTSEEKFRAVPASLVRRYLKEDNAPSAYGDARAKESRRRLCVCARDVYRLVDRFDHDLEIAALENYGLLVRLFEEQCEIVEKAAEPPPGAVAGDADMDEPYVPVVPAKPKDVGSDSLQSPHDPDATYSGHKGKGYEVQVCETCGNQGKPEIITHVEVTDSCASDADAAIPVVENLEARGIKPDELIADTSYGGADNVIACGACGVELVSPLAGKKAAEPRDQDHDEHHDRDRDRDHDHDHDDDDLSVGDFDFDLAGKRTVRCPAGEEAIEERRKGGKGRKRRKRHGTGPVDVEAFFDPAHCEGCPHREACPVKTMKDGRRRLKTKLQRATIERRRRETRTRAWKKRYDIRAGIEATNSELKRKHGLDDLRVRGKKRVALSARLKALACDMKRMGKYILGLDHAVPAMA